MVSGEHPSYEINVFLSHGQGDAAAAVELAQALEAVGVGVWRDRDKLYKSPRWPRSLGAAVVDQDALVLVWSESAADSKFVELEWCTALALGKLVLVYCLDDSPLPSALSVSPTIQAEDPVTDAQRLLEELRAQLAKGQGQGQGEWLLSALEQIEPSEPEAAFRTVRGLLTSAATTAIGQPTHQPDKEGHSLFAPGAVVGERYEIRGLLGEGGMGAVWRAFDLKLRVEVALKVLFGADDRSRDQLRREVRTARAVVSSNVCRIFDLGEAGDTEFLSMEYVDGMTLARLMAEEGPLAVDRASPLASQMLAGLQAIHDAGLVHRDIKPENLMVTRTGRLVVMDLGLARWRTDDAVFSVSGTPAYLAPEQLRGEKVDARCDVYAAGVVLAELTCPQGAADLEQRQRVWRGLQRAPPELPDTPWAPVLATAVARDPDERPASAEALARALEKETVKTISDADARPYPGLAAFTEADAEYFFGREAEVEALWKKLQQQPRLLAVVGPSGAGKSSFLRAGVIAARPPDWSTLVVTPGGNPFVTLGQALARALADDRSVAEMMVRFSELDVAVELIRRWQQTSSNGLLIIDQFEELFTQNLPEVQAKFSELLGRLPLEADVHVLLGMRDDFLYHCHQYPALAPILSELTLLGPPTGDALRRALVQPVLKCGFRFEDEALVDEMVAEVEDELGALPLLAFAAAELWERRDREQGLLTRAVYEEIGGVAGALAGHAEATLERIGQDRLPLVRELFRNLVTAQGTRAERDREELLSVFSEADREAAAEVLAELIDARLLVSHEEEREEEEHHRIQIIHESLLETWPRLVRWQTQDADAAQMRDQLRQAAHMWDDRDRSEDLLWSGTAYREFELWRERYPGRLTDTEQAFAKAMVDKNARQRRRRQTAVAAVIAITLFIAGTTSFLWQQSETARQQAAQSEQQARDEARRAEASKLLALADLRRAQDPTEALAYTTASLELADSREARIFALRLLWEAPPAIELNQGGQHARILAFNPEGNRLAGGDQKGQARVWPDDGGKPEVLRGHEAKVAPIIPRWASSELLVTGHGNGIGINQFLAGSRVVIWNVAQGKRIRTIDFGEESWWLPGVKTLFAQTREGESDAGVLRSWRLPHGEPAELSHVTSHPLSLISGFVPNGDGWVYARGDTVYFRPLPSKSDGGNDRVLGRHPADVMRIRPLGSEPDKLYSSDQAGGIRIWSFSDDQPELVNAIPGMDTEYRIPTPSLRWAIGDFWNTRDHRARLWNLGPWREARPLTLRRSGSWYAASFAFHPQSRWLVVSTHSFSRLTFWPLIDRFPLVVDGYERVTRPVSFSPNGDWLATSWSKRPGDRLRLWPLPGSDDTKVRELKQLPESANWWELSFDPKGRYLFLVGDAYSAYIVPLDGSNPRQLQDVPGGLHYGAAVSPGGHRVATAFGYGEGPKILKVWNLNAGTSKVLKLPPGSPSNTGYERGVTTLAFADKTTLYTAGDGGVRRWDLTNDTWEFLFATQPGFTVDMAINPNNERAAVKERPLNPESGYRSDVKMLDLASGEVQSLPGFTACEGAHPIAFSGSLVADQCEGIIRVGRASGGEPHLLPGHDGPVQNLAISPDERWIASTGDDNTLRLWPMPDLDKQPLHTLPRDKLIAKLKSLTNIRVVRDPDSADGWKVKLDEFPGWREMPQW